MADVDTSEFASGSTNIHSPAAKGGGRRARRMSMSPEMGVTRPREQLPFPPETIGTYSCHGVEPGNRVGETMAKINQDRGCIIYPYGPNDDMALFCVYDGHGSNGDKVSQYVSENVARELTLLLDEDSHKSPVPSPKHALIETFDKVDAMLKKEPTIDSELSGTTAVVLLYKFDSKTQHTVWAACSGDSRATMQYTGNSLPPPHHRKVIDLTVDQKPDTPAENDRIKKAGGVVSPPEEEWGGPARVWLDANMTLPGLAMARSLGDHLVKTVGVIATPEVAEYMIDPNLNPLVCMATDGVWEFIESEAAFDILNKTAQESESATSMCVKLIEESANKWRHWEGDYRDDITAICIKVKEMNEFHFANKSA